MKLPNRSSTNLQSINQRSSDDEAVEDDGSKQIELCLGLCTPSEVDAEDDQAVEDDGSKQIKLCLETREGLFASMRFNPSGIIDISRNL
jgi:hypothetical protein